ncbi:RagB/SusD family nutrient uptake outer membrane protein [Sinomicrobium kalidii]|uniref:RagB/SusD family nutrient uptake outer membrane protein n=1 Tax=Sinomicrobium kalidii TaxID=2900738 RepID=UPI001E3D524A|nr:RagB/SusD family nutrient uptake outer membrane protein [Sinomicrobium kalidii]UGU15736.1 RagB/SusD family nutrient uptake outer membrane protein [Sinomicrobium kalidii]
MKITFSRHTSAILASFFFFVSCEDFVDVDLPDDKIASQTVFANDNTALDAMQGIYNQLFNVQFSSGSSSSVTFLSGLSADTFMVISSNQTNLEFLQNEITIQNSKNLSIWNSAYNIIYQTNAVLEGIENSNTLSDIVVERLNGEAMFVRAFCYFYLVNLYGDVPLILTTDYSVNTLASREDLSLVYTQIISDLEYAIDVLGIEYEDKERIYANRYVAMALLARVHLYLQNWKQAESLSNEIIQQTAIYEILEDPDVVFMANSKEAIWQISPIGSGEGFGHTNEGNQFIITSAFSNAVVLSDSFMTIWDSDDKRSEHWIGNIVEDGEVYNYPYKYKVQFDDSGSEETISEYSMVLRLAEQYLIRAEARVQLGDLPGAISDLDVIRKRANLPLISEINPSANAEELEQLLLEERRKELFTEWGHRWMDLKRWGKASDILGQTKDDTIEPMDLLYPIPEEERNKNPNLSQNPGY